METTRKSRRNHGAKFKARSASGLRGDKTFSELAERFKVRPTQIVRVEKQLLKRAAEAFEDRAVGAL